MFSDSINVFKRHLKRKLRVVPYKSQPYWIRNPVSPHVARILETWIRHKYMLSETTSQRDNTLFVTYIPLLGSRVKSLNNGYPGESSSHNSLVLPRQVYERRKKRISKGHTHASTCFNAHGLLDVCTK